MSFRERKRLEVFSRVGRGEMTLVEASEMLRLSYRQTKRVWSRYKAVGDTRLVLCGRGRASNRQSPYELHDNIEQPARCRAHSGRFSARSSFASCSSYG